MNTRLLMPLALACLLLSCRLGFSKAWWEEAWTENETPYRQARVQVDKARGKTNTLVGLVSKWQLRAQSKPFDRLANYRWGYALYWLTRARVGEEDTKAYKEYGQIREALHRSTFADEVPPNWRSRSYEFNRLRFWVEQKANVPLWQLGERILRRNPNDAETQDALLKIWTGNCPPPKKTAAITLWRKVATRYRNDPITTYWLARVHDAAYNADRRKYGSPNPADARKAVELYQRFLREAPDTARYQRPRKLAEMLMRTVAPASTRKS